MFFHVDFYDVFDPCFQAGFSLAPREKRKSAHNVSSSNNPKAERLRKYSEDRYLPVLLTKKLLWEREFYSKFYQIPVVKK
jgi:hypothetical protein